MAKETPKPVQVRKITSKDVCGNISLSLIPKGQPAVTLFRVGGIVRSVITAEVAVFSGDFRAVNLIKYAAPDANAKNPPAHFYGQEFISDNLILPADASLAVETALRSGKGGSIQFAFEVGIKRVDGGGFAFMVKQLQKPEMDATMAKLVAEFIRAEAA